MKPVTLDALNLILKDSKEPLDFVKPFFIQYGEKFSEQQLHESLRVRKRIFEKTIFDCGRQMTNDEIEKQLEKNLYFVTIQFDPSTHYRKFGRNQQLAQANAIASLYADMVKATIDYAFTRNSKLLPFLQLYLDAEGSRFTGHLDEIRVPHYHGLLLLHPKNVARFEEWLSAFGLKIEIDGIPAIKLNARHHHPIETITFSKFDPKLGSLESLISYVTKFLKNERFWNSNGGDLTEAIFHPQVPMRAYPFYSRISKPIFTHDDFASFEKHN